MNPVSTDSESPQTVLSGLLLPTYLPVDTASVCAPEIFLKMSLLVCVQHSPGAGEVQPIVSAFPNKGPQKAVMCPQTKESRSM